MNRLPPILLAALFLACLPPLEHRAAHVEARLENAHARSLLHCAGPPEDFVWGDDGGADGMWLYVRPFPQAPEKEATLLVDLGESHLRRAARAQSDRRDMHAHLAEVRPGECRVLIEIDRGAVREVHASGLDLYGVNADRQCLLMFEPCARAAAAGVPVGAP